MLNTILTNILEIGAYVPGIVAIAAALAVFGAAWGIGGIGKSAMEAIARQPEAAGNVRSSMIIAGALVEGATLFAIVVCILAVLK
ncbi:MAG: ATP synthase F0 subunit C [Bacteroidales bacterium]|jgi:F-type H+-transporting ATPase subunit c|nr:ATP synthase F0 subunit C [Bacteroidales bacterium]